MATGGLTIAGAGIGVTGATVRVAGSLEEPRPRPDHSATTPAARRAEQLSGRSCFSRRRRFRAQSSRLATSGGWLTADLPITPADGPFGFIDSRPLARVRSRAILTPVAVVADTTFTAGTWAGHRRRGCGRRSRSRSRRGFGSGLPVTATAASSTRWAVQLSGWLVASADPVPVRFLGCGRCGARAARFIRISRSWFAGPSNSGRLSLRQPAPSSSVRRSRLTWRQDNAEPDVAPPDARVEVAAGR